MGEVMICKDETQRKLGERAWDFLEDQHGLPPLDDVLLVQIQRVLDDYMIDQVEKKNYPMGFVRVEVSKRDQGVCVEGVVVEETHASKWRRHNAV